MRRSNLSQSALSAIHCSRWIICCAIALLAGCADPTATPPSLSEVPKVDPSAGLVAAYGVAPVPSEFSWYQGQSAKLLGSAADRVCYLTYVAGDFDGTTEWVGITISLGKWWLTGGSARLGVNAKARCIPVSSYSAEITAVSTNGWAVKNLSGYSCGFTRIGGRFDSYVDDAWIGDYEPTWPTFLTVYNSSGGYMEARARCITSRVYTTNPVPWFGSTTQTLVSPASSWTCFLTRMRGPFEGSGDWIAAFKGTSVWYVSGASHSYRSAAGSCVK